MTGVQTCALPILEKAFQIANEANLSLKELQDMEAEERAIQEQQGIVSRGIEEGLERARVQLMREGMQAGMQAGIKAGQRALILRLLERRVGAVNPDVVSRIGELSVEELESLVEEVVGFSSLSDLMVWLEQNNR